MVGNIYILHITKTAEKTKKTKTKTKTKNRASAFYHPDPLYYFKNNSCTSYCPPKK